ncbi:protein MALE DISCOVERER 2-like [Zingiber officinale]|nr:protein MALE DISCOVERER 2-like [Zingiber officinale]
MMNTQIHYVPRRKLAEATKNLYANPVNGGPINQIVSVLTTTSGSFPALISKSRLNPSEAPIPLPNPQSVSPTAEPTKPAGNEIPSSESISTWTYILIISAAALLLTLAACIVLVCRRKDGANIGPWKTGLSGQLQKALVTGVPKLKRLELEAACEEFSNIVLSYPAFTVYKGILSSGVEIAVVSTTITSAKEWSKESEKLFRKKVEALSRINHKNFINLLGYCEEDEPFMRMMVLEYASNGSLYEHLHGEEFELLDWNARMRVIMGIAYCLQHIHELDPPIQHPNLRSRSILVTEDYAAKIVDISVWKEIIDQGKLGVKDYLNNYDTLYDPANNVYSFGVLLMEIVSGKVIQREEEGSILNLVTGYLKGDGGPSSFVDSNVKSHSEEEFRIVCEVIQDCTSSDPRNRPSMREVTSKLRKIIDISPEAAIPRLSPLWWAELEILSVEAS